MARIDLTMKKENLPEWGLWEGTREIYQNAADAVQEHGGEMSCEWRASKTSRLGGRLHVENTGSTIPRKALLTGHTSKADRDDLIGHFGEGMKVGILAIVRLGREVTIRTGSEVWKPRLVHSDEFDEVVLSFQIQTGRKEERRVEVEVEMTREEWQGMREKFLALSRRTEGDRVEVSSGALLLAPRFSGKVFVKGIYVCENSALVYGYDLRCRTDRDRKMVEDGHQAMREVLSEAVSARPALFGDFYALLAQGGEDVRGITEYDGGAVEPAIRRLVVSEFQRKHGEDAVPVGDQVDAAELSALGKKGVVVSASLRGLFAAEFGDLYTLKRRLREEVLQVYADADLSQAEREVLASAFRRLATAAPEFSSEIVDVCDFRDRRREGGTKDGRVQVARRLLEDPRATLRVLVREAARSLWIDECIDHLARVERVWSGIVAGMEVPTRSLALVRVG